MFFSQSIIILTETWLPPDISDAELGLNYFTIYRLDRNINNNSHSRGGGVLIAVITSISSSLFTLINPCVDHIFVLLSIDQFSLLIGPTYLPSFSSILFIKYHLSMIKQLLSNHKLDMVHLLGDLLHALCLMDF